MKEEVAKGVHRNWRLAINTKSGVQPVQFHDRNTAQIAVNNKFVYREISHEEWSRLTDLLSGSSPLVSEISGSKSSTSNELCLADK